MDKIVYVLVSEDTDYYLEEMIISIISLRRYNQDVEVVVVTDNITKKRIDNFKIDILKSVSQYIVREFPDSIKPHLRSRYLKTSLRDIISGKFLFVDCDTIFAGSIKSIFNINVDIGMVLDRHSDLSDLSRYLTVKKNINVFEPLIGDILLDYFNSGVMLVDDNRKTKEFFHSWHEEYKKSNFYGNYQDQPPLAVVNLKYGGVISKLDGVYNCQMDRGVKYLSDAVVIHYLGVQYNTNVKIGNVSFLMHEIADLNLFKDFRNNNWHLTNDLKKILSSPKRSIKDLVTVPTDTTVYKVINSDMFSFMCLCYTSHHVAFKTFNSLIELLLKYYRLVKNRKH